MGGMTWLSDFLASPVLGDVVRVVILFIGFTLAMACIKFALIAVKAKEPYRGWGLASYGLFVLTPALSGLFRFGEPLNWWTTASYFAGLFCGLMALRVSYTLDPTWRRLRAEERAARDARRANEDVLRAEDRVSQSEERAESRAAYDVEHPAINGDQEARDEVRAGQDAEREHSHELQDDERSTVRHAEDRDPR